jgi:hypothetical protein
MFHAKYLSYRFLGFSHTKKLSAYYIHVYIRKINDPLGQGRFRPFGIYLNTLQLISFHAKHLNSSSFGFSQYFFKNYTIYRKGKSITSGTGRILTLGHLFVQTR